MKNENDNIGNKLDLADSWLTKFGTILKKNWGKLLFILFCYCVYWVFTQPPVKEPQIQSYPAEGGIYSDSAYADSLTTK